MQKRTEPIYSLLQHIASRFNENVGERGNNYYAHILNTLLQDIETHPAWIANDIDMVYFSFFVSLFFNELRPALENNAPGKTLLGEHLQQLLSERIPVERIRAVYTQDLPLPNETLNTKEKMPLKIEETDTASKIQLYVLLKNLLSERMPEQKIVALPNQNMPLQNEPLDKAPQPAIPLDPYIYGAQQCVIFNLCLTLRPLFEEPLATSLEALIYNKCASLDPDLESSLAELLDTLMETKLPSLSPDLKENLANSLNTILENIASLTPALKKSLDNLNKLMDNKITSLDKLAITSEKKSNIARDKREEGDLQSVQGALSETCRYATLNLGVFAPRGNPITLPLATPAVAPLIGLQANGSALDNPRLAARPG